MGGGVAPSLARSAHCQISVVTASLGAWLSHARAARAPRATVPRPPTRELRNSRAGTGQAAAAAPAKEKGETERTARERERERRGKKAEKGILKRPLRWRAAFATSEPSIRPCRGQSRPFHFFGRCLKTPLLFKVAVTLSLFSHRLQLFVRNSICSDGRSVASSSANLVSLPSLSRSDHSFRFLISPSDLEPLSPSFLTSLSPPLFPLDPWLIQSALYLFRD